MKKWFALVLAVCMLIVSVPAAMADSWGVFEGETPLYGSSANKIANIQKAIEALELKRALPVPIEKITPCIN